MAHKTIAFSKSLFQTGSKLSRRNVLRTGAALTFGNAAISSIRSAKAAKPEKQSTALHAPPWLKDLIIYEIAPRGFTSPDGPQSGTFKSLQDKLPHLEELGVTGIWLAGYSHGDPHHFYNIWTQYALIEPDKFDPALGTEQDFAALINDAHQRGIKVFLDVITHGLMDYSPVVKAHPNWFRGSSWGMKDFDWHGSHKDLDNWWVNIYTNFVTRYGVDGFRLDVGIYRPDLWKRIRRNAAAAGHPIVIFSETNTAIPDVTDFTQHKNLVQQTTPNSADKLLLNNLPGFYDSMFGRTGNYRVKITYADGTSARGGTHGGGTLKVRLAGLTCIKAGRGVAGAAETDGLPYGQLILENVSGKIIQDITVHSDIDQWWQLHGRHDAGAWVTRPIIVEYPSPTTNARQHQVKIYIATLAWGESSIQLSCHDNGWTGFPQNMNPYVTQGSRSTFGYTCLLAPMIPIFFSGEEFNATYHALPGLSPDLYGGKDPGKGRWLYGCQLNWNDMKQSDHRDMFTDAKRIIAIRRKYSAILSAWPADKIPNVKAVSCQSNLPAPAPYLRWNDQTAIVVIGNRNTSADINMTLNLSMKDIGLSGRSAYKITDLWSDQLPVTCSENNLHAFSCSVKRDKIAGGGLSVFKIDAIS